MSSDSVMPRARRPLVALACAAVVAAALPLAATLPESSAIAPSAVVAPSLVPPPATPVFGPAIDAWLQVTSRQLILYYFTIPAGARCLLMFGSANRDAAVFAHPHRPVRAVFASRSGASVTTCAVAESW